MVKDRRKWSAFKDEKDVSQAQRTQDLQKISREAAPGEETTIPKPWIPKWMKEKQEFEAEEAKHHAEAAAEAANNNNNNININNNTNNPMAAQSPSTGGLLSIGKLSLGRTASHSWYQ